MVVEDQIAPVSGVDIDGGVHAERAKVSDIDEHDSQPPVVALHALHELVDLFVPDSVGNAEGKQGNEENDDDHWQAQNEHGPVE